MKCKKCGASIPNSAVCCPACGTAKSSKGNTADMTSKVPANMPTKAQRMLGSYIPSVLILIALCLSQVVSGALGNGLALLLCLIGLGMAVTAMIREKNRKKKK